MSQNIMTLDDVARHLKVHPSTIYRLLKKKQLPAFKVGRDWRFHLDTIEAWARDLEENMTLARGIQNGREATSSVLSAKA